MLTLDLKKRVVKFIERLPKKQAGQIMRKIVALLSDPYPQDSKLLKGASFYRADSGEYRIG